MEDKYLDLEAMVETEELLEPDLEQEPLLEEIPEEMEDPYLVQLDRLEIQKAIDEQHELPTEDPEYQYRAEKQLAEIQKAIYRQKL